MFCCESLAIAFVNEGMKTSQLNMVAETHDSKNGSSNNEYTLATITMDKSVTNSSTNLTKTSSEPNGYTGTRTMFKIVLVSLILVDAFFVGVFVPVALLDMFSLQSVIVFGYLIILVIALAGVVAGKAMLLVPVQFVWLSMLISTVAVIGVAAFEFSSCSWQIYFNPDQDIRSTCRWTFMKSYMDAVLYALMLGVKISQLFIVFVVSGFAKKSNRMHSFETNKEAPESDDEDMVVFERVASSDRQSKVRDATGSIA